MEALTAVSVAALTIYDMLKPIDKDMEIISTKLIEKKGGKSDFVERIPTGFTAAVIVTSDGTHQGTREDKSGKIIRERLEQFSIQPSYTILPDDEELIGEYLFINSNNPIGQSMSLAQLFEAISRFARTPEKEVDDRDPDLGEYGYNPINDKIEGVQTPTRHQMLKAKNEIKEDRLRRLGLGAIHRIEQDQKDRGIIDSGSVDDIFRRFDDNPPRENK
jgi:hypothetical protein